MPKYSIIIPAYNGMPYLKSCVESIISQNYDDYELIISEDHSTDGTAEYLDSLSDSHVKCFHCPQRLSMAEHWEWALSHASGTWQMFVGQDDGLQGYFFKLADKLTEICNKKNIKVLMSERAYFFWPGCEKAYGNDMVVYNSNDFYRILDTRYEVFNALYRTKISYMDFPSMYTTSIFRKDFIEEIKEKQNGVLFTTHPQDANLAALVAALQKRYLKSYIPLGWVGSSVKSAGLAVSNGQNAGLKEDYLNKIKSSNLKVYLLVDVFKLDSHPIYFWGALLVVCEKLNYSLYKKIQNRKIKKLIFANALSAVTPDKKAFFEDFLLKNKLTIDDLDSNFTLTMKVKEKIARNVNKKIRKMMKLDFAENIKLVYKHGDFEYSIEKLNKYMNEKYFHF